MLMEEECEKSTTSEGTIDSVGTPFSYKLMLDVNPRKVPKCIVEANNAKLALLKNKVHALRVENEGLRAENSAMKKNIERYYELVLQAREKKKVTGSSNVSSATLCAGIIIACTVHLSTESGEKYGGERRPILLKSSEWSILFAYLAVLAAVVIWNWQRNRKRCELV
jgi:hypothetical protein